MKVLAWGLPVLIHVSRSFSQFFFVNTWGIHRFRSRELHSPSTPSNRLFILLFDAVQSKLETASLNKQTSFLLQESISVRTTYIVKHARGHKHSTNFRRGKWKMLNFRSWCQCYKSLNRFQSKCKNQ
jgi:hypothetical protein